MNKKTLKNGFSLPELGIGTWPMGGFTHHNKKNDDEKDIEALKFAIKNGITHIDTAELYACGYSEELLSKAIQDIPREKLQIASKVKGSNASYKAIKNACKNSLKRVGCEYFDLYYIHWREDQFDLQESMKAMEELVEEGLIKHIGVSNFSSSSLEKAQSFCKYKIVANQVHYNLIFREVELELLEYCQQNDVMIVAYRPLELGKLANFCGHIANSICETYDKTHAQLAINFLVSQENVVTIFGSSDRKHIQENLGGVGWYLKKEDFELLKNDRKKVLYKSDCIELN